MIAPHHNIPPPPPSVPAPEEDAALDEALLESFPASDAPSFSAHPEPRRRVEAPRVLPTPLSARDEEVLKWSPTSQTPEVQVVKGHPLPPALDEERDLVDEALRESFPASDPPWWTLGRDLK